VSKRDPEQQLWDDIRGAMVGRWHAQRHEDRYSTGIPDVSFGIGRRSDGWVELKYLPKWPASRMACNKPWDFSYDHFTAEQRNWMSLRARHGTGRVFLICRFGDTCTLVWNWARIEKLLGVAPLDKVVKAASAQWWHAPIDPEELEQVLSGNRIIPPRFRIPTP